MSGTLAMRQSMLVPYWSPVSVTGGEQEAKVDVVETIMSDGGNQPEPFRKGIKGRDPFHNFS
jgi:hypothetical protein